LGTNSKSVDQQSELDLTIGDISDLIEAQQTLCRENFGLSDAWSSKDFLAIADRNKLVATLRPVGEWKKSFGNQELKDLFSDLSHALNNTGISEEADWKFFDDTRNKDNRYSCANIEEASSRLFKIRQGLNNPANRDALLKSGVVARVNAAKALALKEVGAHLPRRTK
jgi:hypothetical protein